MCSMKQLHEYQVNLYMNEEDIKARSILSQQREQVRDEIKKKNKGCKCKGGKCTWRCGCIKNGVKRVSSCTCNGKCCDVAPD